MILLSIVIPVYNVEKYIGKCLTSCITQKGVPPECYEIIIVNDGTKDNSIGVVSHIIENNTNIRLIDKENGGLSSARNEGLVHAKGRYVWFVDSDDYIDNDSVSCIINDINKSNSDIFFYNINCVYENDITENIKVMSSQVSPFTQSGSKWLRDGIQIWPMAQMFVFKIDFLRKNQLEFKEGILHEDVEFKFRAFLLSDMITYIPQKHYNYLLRSNGSISAVFSPKRMYDLYNIIQEECILLEGLNNIELKRNASFALIRNFENYINFVSSNRISYKDSKIKKLFTSVKPWLKQCLSIISIKYKLKYSTFLITPQILYYWFFFRSKA